MDGIQEFGEAFDRVPLETVLWVSGRRQMACGCLVHVKRCQRFVNKRKKTEHDITII